MVEILDERDKQNTYLSNYLKVKSRETSHADNLWTEHFREVTGHSGGIIHF